MDIIVNRKKKRNVLVSLGGNQTSEYDKLFLELIDGYEIFQFSIYDIFYTKDDKVFIRYENLTKYAYINYELIWDVFKSKFNLNYIEVQELMKVLLETHLKLMGTIPKRCLSINKYKLNRHLKWKEKHQNKN